MRVKAIVIFLMILLLGQSAFPNSGRGFHDVSISVRYSLSIGVLKLRYQSRLGLHVGTFWQPLDYGELLVPVGVTFNLYQNGLGAQNIDGGLRSRVNYDMVLSGGLQAGSVRRSLQKEYLDSTFPFNKSQVINHAWGLGFGTKWVMMDFFKKKTRKSQQVGYLNAQAWRFQINYSNDGAFPLGLRLGDYFDRYWTGGALLSYECDAFRANIGFDRFTGFKKDAYEFATMMGYKRVYYDQEQTWYNRGEWHASILSKQEFENFGISLKLTDFPILETQDLIHFRGRMAIHPTPNKKNIFIGAIYDYNN